MAAASFCDGKVYRVPTPVFEDARGSLATLDFARYGFQPTRAFLVTAPPGSVRGGHGHRSGRQLLMRLSGEIEVEDLELNATHSALVIESPVWSRQFYLGINPLMVVFCDTPYDPDDYVVSIEGSA
jgi:hypothetical protein